MNRRVLVAVSASKTIYGKIVRWLMDSCVDHVFFVIESPEWGGWLSTEVNERGMLLVPAEHAIHNCLRVNFFECVESLWDGLRANRLYIGKKYDWLGIFGFVFRIIVWYLSGRRFLRPVIFCSDFCMSVLKSSCIKGTELVDSLSVSPKDLYSFLTDSDMFRHMPGSFMGRR